MAFDETITGYGFADAVRGAEPEHEADLVRTRRRVGAGRKSPPQPIGVRPDAKRPPTRSRDEQPDPEKTLVIQVDSRKAEQVKPEDRERASNILNQIGQRFANNRRKGKSNAYEEYQRDLAENAQFLILGGLTTVKELSELFMKIEDFRKQSSEQGKNASTILAEWLSGRESEEVKAVESILAS